MVLLNTVQGWLQVSAGILIVLRPIPGENYEGNIIWIIPPLYKGVSSTKLKL